MTISRGLDASAAADAADGDAALGPDANLTSPDAAPGPDGAPSVEIRLNINGPDHTGVDYPGTWAADPGDGGACGPLYYTNNNPITGTMDDALFHNVAYGPVMTCAVGNQLPAGNYQVTLYFAEIYWGSGCPGGGGSGSRVFDIELEGTTLRNDVDLFDLEGGCATNGGSPHLETFTLLINDGTLNISLAASADNGMVSAVELVSLF
jgi:hypothetical protein